MATNEHVFCGAALLKSFPGAALATFQPVKDI
jgi:hypothetical protein